jgi:itaconate CoA-transferase
VLAALDSLASWRARWKLDAGNGLLLGSWLMTAERKLLVISLEQAVAAPLCSRRLADFGARVIKVERPGGDFAREYDHTVSGWSTYFVWLNRGKESICLDLKLPADVALLVKMASTADVLIQNLRPGGLGGLGIDLEALRQRNKRLITCSISGYGPDGPYADRKAYDLLIQAECGLAAITGSPAEPSRVGVSVVDISAGLTAYEAILEALIRRQCTGAGEHIEVSLFDSISEWMAVPLLHARYGTAPSRVGLRHPNIAPYGAYRCRDGAEILIGIQNAREWQELCSQVLEMPQLATDARYRANTDRVTNREQLDAEIQNVIARKSLAEICASLESAQIAYAQINDPMSVLNHPHLRTLEVTIGNGVASIPTPAARNSAQPRVPRVVPHFDQHGAAIRQEFSGRID